MPIPLRTQLTALKIENEHLRDVNWHLSKLVNEIGKNAELVTNERRVYGDPKYSYIPFDNTIFLRALISIRWKLYREGFGRPYTGKGNKPLFLDVGCGIGDKLVLARQLDCCACGIEYNKYLIRYAKRVLGATDSERLAVKKSLPYICQCDALHCNYHNYNIIFLNAPFQDRKTEMRLEHRIYSQAALGAFIMMPTCLSRPSDDYVQGKNFGDDSLLVYRRLHKNGKKITS